MNLKLFNQFYLLEIFRRFSVPGAFSEPIWLSVLDSCEAWVMIGDTWGLKFDYIKS